MTEREVLMCVWSITGTTATVQVCFDMTSIDDIRNLKLQCATTFKYNPVNPTGRWTLIATSRADFGFLMR